MTIWSLWSSVDRIQSQLSLICIAVSGKFDLLLFCEVASFYNLHLYKWYSISISSTHTHRGELCCVREDAIVLMLRDAKIFFVKHCSEVKQNLIMMYFRASVGDSELFSLYTTVRAIIFSKFSKRGRVLG